MMETRQLKDWWCALYLPLQDLAQVRDEGLIQEILTNSGLKIVLGGIGDADAGRFSRLFGSRERLFRTQTASAGQGVGQSQSSGSHRGAGSHQRGGNQSRQQSVSWGRAPRLRAEFTATELRELPDHHAVIERRDQQGHLTPATLVHFDADLQRTLTQHQRQMVWGPDAELLNHLHPFFPRPPRPRQRITTPLPATGALPPGAGVAAAAGPAPAGAHTPGAAPGLPVTPALPPGPGHPASVTPVQGVLPFPADDPPAAAPDGHPAAADAAGDPPAPESEAAPLDPAVGAQLLRKHLALDAGSADFLATTAAAQGYTAAAFAALLTAVQALPANRHPVAVLNQHLTRPAAPEARLPAAGEEGHA